MLKAIGEWLGRALAAAESLRRLMARFPEQGSPEAVEDGPDPFEE
jgi:hypothetical protein